MSRMKAEMIGQPQEMATGPPSFQATPKVVKQPARIEMMENEMAKFWKPDQLRLQLLLVAQLGELAVRPSLRLLVSTTTVPPSGPESTREDGGPVSPNRLYSGFNGSNV